MTGTDFGSDINELRQQVLALASIKGVLIAALRQGGLMSSTLEHLVASDLAAGARSEQARPVWEGVVAAVLKVAAAAGAETG